jgi:hypothetical protein
MRRHFGLLFFICLTAISTKAQHFTFDYNNNCKKAYGQYLSLQLPEGNATIIQEVRQNPYNLLATYIADYDDFLVLLFNGNNEEWKQRKGHFDDRLNLINKGDDQSPWFRLCKAGIYLHWAILHGRFGDNFKAATQFRKSYQLLKENKEKFPAFSPNDVFLGLEEAVVSTIPEDYKWLASVFGMKGNVKNGIARLNNYLNNNNNDVLKEEALLYSCYLKFYLLSQQVEVWNFVNSNNYPVQGNLMRAFVKTNLSLNFRKAETAIQTLRYAQTLSNYNQFPTMDYEFGNAFMLKLDYTNAIIYLQRYCARNTGKLYTKDCWQKMAFAWYLQQNQAKAQYCLEQIKTQGNAMVDADKQALHFAEKGIWPHPALLQARLLIEGGFYNLALSRLTALKENDLVIPDKLEYYFRLARIYDELDDDQKALQFYRTAISAGQEREEQYAARSALQVGLMYERKNNRKEAINYFQLCLKMRHHDFQSSLDQQAKAGLNRLSANYLYGAHSQ